MASIPGGIQAAAAARAAFNEPYDPSAVAVENRAPKRALPLHEMRRLPERRAEIAATLMDYRGARMTAARNSKEHECRHANAETDRWQEYHAMLSRFQPRR